MAKPAMEIQIVIIWVILNQRPNKIIAKETELLVLPLKGNYWDAQDCPCNYEWIWGLGPSWAWFIMPGSSRNAEEMDFGMTRLWWLNSWSILPLSLAVRWRNSILVYLASVEAVFIMSTEWITADSRSIHELTRRQNITEWAMKGGTKTGWW